MRCCLLPGESLSAGHNRTRSAWRTGCVSWTGFKSDAGSTAKAFGAPLKLGTAINIGEPQTRRDSGRIPPVLEGPSPLQHFRLAHARHSTPAAQRCIPCPSCQLVRQTYVCWRARPAVHVDGQPSGPSPLRQRDHIHQTVDRKGATGDGTGFCGCSGRRNQ